MHRLRAVTLGVLGLLVAAAAPTVQPAAAQEGVRATTRPAVVETRVIGHSVAGRPILVWRLGQPTSARKVVVLAAMHGNETAPARILYDLRDGRPIRGADIWVVPQYNPDGVARRTRQNARGVDLNRNYPRGWVAMNGSYESGSGPASEPETAAMMAFLSEVRPSYVVSFHQPLRGIGRAGAKGAAFVGRLHRTLRLPVKSFNCSGACHGTMTEWYNAAFGGVAVTVEYAARLSYQQAHRTGPRGLLRAVGATR